MLFRCLQNLKLMENMENKSQEIKKSENILKKENKNAILLQELISEINKYLTQNKQEIGCLADILKRIFYSGLTSLINVSKNLGRCIRKKLHPHK